MAPIKTLIAALFLSVFVCACSNSGRVSLISSHEPAQNLTTFKLSSEFLPSGSIVLSRQLPAEGQVDGDVAIPGSSAAETAGLAALVGYFPPSDAFLPADNETWIMIESASSKILVFRGETKVKEIQAEGKVTMGLGNYNLQHKQKRPLWYANDDYFAKRNLPIPPAGDRARYRRGALGTFVLYPKVDFPIHSGPIWSEDVGGLRVSRADLSAIYYMVPVGTAVVVK